MKAPKLLFLANLIIFVTFMSPIGYIIWRFFTFSRSLSSFFESWDVISLFINTISLFIAVVLTSVFIGLFVSIVLTRIDIKWSTIWFTLCALPLVIPSYIGALTYVSAFSPKGLFVQLFNGLGLTEIPGLDGFLGSWIVLSASVYMRSSTSVEKANYIFWPTCWVVCDFRLWGRFINEVFNSNKSHI